jgi:hypothetical protein
MGRVALTPGKKGGSRAQKGKGVRLELARAARRDRTAP